MLTIRQTDSEKATAAQQEPPPRSPEVLYHEQVSIHLKKGAIEMAKQTRRGLLKNAATAAGAALIAKQASPQTGQAQTGQAQTGQMVKKDATGRPPTPFPFTTVV